MGAGEDDMTDERCLMCGQSIQRAKPGPKRICAKCQSPIGRHDRWEFIPGGPTHLDCAAPKGFAPLIPYQPKQT